MEYFIMFENGVLMFRQGIQWSITKAKNRDKETSDAVDWSAGRKSDTTIGQSNFV